MCFLLFGQGFVFYLLLFEPGGGGYCLLLGQVAFLILLVFGRGRVLFLLFGWEGGEGVFYFFAVRAGACFFFAVWAGTGVHSLTGCLAGL